MLSITIILQALLSFAAVNIMWNENNVVNS